MTITKYPDHLIIQKIMSISKQALSGSREGGKSPPNPITAAASFEPWRMLAMWDVKIDSDRIRKPLCLGEATPLEQSSLRLFTHAHIGARNPTSSVMHHLQCNDQDMIHCICSVTTKDQVCSQDLLEGSSSMVWRRYSTPVDSDGMAMSNAVMVGWRKSCMCSWLLVTLNLLVKVKG